MRGYGRTVLVNNSGGDDDDLGGMPVSVVVECVVVVRWETGRLE